MRQISYSHAIASKQFAEVSNISIDQIIIGSVLPNLWSFFEPPWKFAYTTDQIEVVVIVSAYNHIRVLVVGHPRLLNCIFDSSLKV